MPRLNIYLPDDIYELANKWRSSSNLSEICAKAIKDELVASEDSRSYSRVLEKIRPSTDLEVYLETKFKLRDVIVEQAPTDLSYLRDTIGRAAAGYLDRMICDGSLLAVAGGRQIWCMVQHLSPRRVRTTITALGMHQADPQLLHAHPNTIATLMWLLYSPRSQAHVVGSLVSPNPWLEKLPGKPHPSYFVISSCSRLEEKSPFAQLIGDDSTASLKRQGALGDYAYVFFDHAGKEIEVTPAEHQFRFSAPLLRNLSNRDDVRTVLVAGGEEKLDAIRITLEANLCNVLITDARTAKGLLE
jgi:deoxyribonucleoside regulator